jgi:hypothetical protein
MRMMLKVSMQVEAGNAGIKDGSLPRAIQSLMEQVKPEAAYFYPGGDGRRTALFVFDMKEASDIPAIVEPLFEGMNAAVALTPVMNAEDLKKGLSALGVPR